RLSLDGIRCRVMDLRWLAPLPVEDILREARATGRVLIADETRRTAGVSEGVLSILADDRFGGWVKRVTSEDSFVPLGDAADAWLAEPGRRHEIAGITGFRHQTFGLADLTQSGGWSHGLGLGSVTTDTLPSGPGGATRSCVQCAVYLITEDGGPLALLFRGPEE